MPKQKTKSGAKKRFSFTKSGKIKRSQTNRRHILNKKTRKNKRNLRRGAYVDSTQEKQIRDLIPYKA